MKDSKIKESHLRVFKNRSEYYPKNGNLEIFYEGKISENARKRLRKIQKTFSDGFLESLILSIIRGKAEINSSAISENAKSAVNQLISSLTSEVGRALIGLSIMQLCIKAICPEQSIRLHKASSISACFSWKEGISMRTLDKKYVTPTLRKFNLLRLNADGFMMTRSLAENYPYTFLYKAQVKGAKEQWLLLVEELERNKTSPEETLKYLLSKLVNNAVYFTKKANELIELNKRLKIFVTNKRYVLSILKEHFNISDYAARLLEIAMHSLMQATIELEVFPTCEMKPLSQMRSANKKHGNIGDVELLEDDHIIESWDAKYGKGYLREEIEEALEKLENHHYVRLVGFVTTVDIEKGDEISKRIMEIKELYGIDFVVTTFDKWVDKIYDDAKDCTNEVDLSSKWLSLYCEYLAQKRRDVAPIDEPCLEWVCSLLKILKQRILNA